MSEPATETTPLEREDGAVLYFERFLPSPPDAGRALVVITHGFGEHSGRYWHVIAEFNRIGLQVVRYDLRGHGRSTGRRGDAPSFDAFLADLAAVIAKARQHPGFPNGEAQQIFLFGHSMGGLITLRFLEQSPLAIDGAMVSSPWIRLVFEPPKWKLAVAQIAKWLWPTLRLPTGMNPARLSRDEAFLNAMPDLHLSHHFLSARLFHAIQTTCQATRQEADRVHTPLLLLHGQNDPVTCWKATSEFHREAGVEDKTLILYPDTRHEAHNDLDREKVLHDLTAWLAARLWPRPAGMPASPEPPLAPSPPPQE